MNEIMQTLMQHTEDWVTPLSQPTEKMWSLPDLFIRQYLNNGVDGFGMSNVDEMFMYLFSKKNTLIELSMISADGYNNSGFPLWKNHDFKPMKSENLAFIKAKRQALNKALNNQH